MEPNNILKFPKSKRTAPALQVDRERIKAAFPKAGSVMKKSFAWLWLIVRLPVFLAMYWLRTPIIFLLTRISAITLFCWLFSLYAFSEQHTMVRAFGFVSFGSFVLSYAYDFILAAIAPEDMMRTL